MLAAELGYASPSRMVAEMRPSELGAMLTRGAQPDKVPDDDGADVDARLMAALKAHSKGK